MTSGSVGHSPVNLINLPGWVGGGWGGAECSEEERNREIQQAGKTKARSGSWRRGREDGKTEGEKK